MGYSLREGLSFCVAGNQTVFLDLENDGYFTLPMATESAFQRLVQGGGPLDARDVDAISPLLARGIIVEENGPGSVRDRQPAYRYARSFLDHAERRCSLTGCLQSLAQFHLTRWQLKRRGAPFSLRRARELKAPLGLSGQSVDDGIASISASFDRMGLVLTTHEQCLPRSLALSACLSAGNYAHELIIGVKMRPFDAHCWVQVGETVINDTLERTRLFTPILVL